MLVAGNWKMNMTQVEAAACIEAFVRLVDQHQDVDVTLFPPYLSIPIARDFLRGTHVKLGAQNVFWSEKGAYTGQVSPRMLAEAGVTQCLVGHSETRGRFGTIEVPISTLGYFGETDETINLKIAALNMHAIAPILCVGETIAERESNETDAVIANQLERGLHGFDEAELRELVVAYEPVWAIGTGQSCDAAEANRVCGTIRSLLTSRFSEPFAARSRVLYGGSVKASNAAELFAQPEIDGGLVGGASLNPNEFSQIVMAA
jgi:triosephosphate isomerase